MIDKLIIATANKHKLIEIEAIFKETKISAMPKEIPEILEDGKTFIQNSLIKAKAVEYSSENIVIGCDTTVIIDNKILGKPNNINQCREYLEMLSGRNHKVITACSIVCGDNIRTFSEVTEVTFRTLSNEDIEWYISTGEPFDKAGGYGIQGKGSLLIERINGDYFNVVGLPVSRLNQELKMFIKGA